MAKSDCFLHMWCKTHSGQWKRKCANLSWRMAGWFWPDLFPEIHMLLWRFGVSRSYGDLQNIDIIENRSVQCKSVAKWTGHQKHFGTMFTSFNSYANCGVCCVFSFFDCCCCDCCVSSERQSPSVDNVYITKKCLLVELFLHGKITCHRGRVCLRDINGGNFWARWGFVTDGVSAQHVQILWRTGKRWQGGFAKCYEVQDLETKETFAVNAQDNQANSPCSQNPPA